MNLRKLVLAIAVSLALFLSGCGKGSVPITILPLAVSSTSLPTAIISKTYSATLTATGGEAPYTWAIVSGTLPAGISMNSSGVFSGMAPTTSTATITVQVTDSQKPTKAVATQSLTLTVNNPLAFTTTSLKVAAVNVPYQFSLTATGGATPYTWALLSGTLPTGLTLDPTYGVIYGTATVQGSYPVTIQVTDAETPPVVLQQALTLTVGGSVARLAGNYTFLFRGFLNGKQVLQAGSFVADGTGNITSGVTDIVSTSSVNTGVTVTGTYNVDTTGHGTMSLMFGPGGSIGSGTYQLTNSLAGYWAFLENGDGKTTEYGAGLFQTQNTVPTDFTNSKGNWVFGGYGADSSDNRYGAGGTFNLQPVTGAGGTIGSGLMDSNDHGTVAMNTAFTGNIGLADATTGRGTFNFGSANFAWYYTDDSDYIAIETDKVTGSTPLILYNMSKQTTFIPVDNTILNGNGITELTADTGGASETSLGLITFDTKGNYWETIDDNTGGTLTQSKPSGTYAVTSTGRTTWTGLPTSPIMYIFNTDQGYMLGTDANVTYGAMEQQRPPSQTTSSFVNVNAGGTIIGPAVPSQTVEVDIFTADGKGNMTGTYDTSGPNGPVMGVSITATYSVDSTSCASTGSTFNTCGRFPLTDSNNNQVGIGYIIASLSPQRVVIMTTTTGPSINALQQ